MKPTVWTLTLVVLLAAAAAAAGAGERTHVMVVNDDGVDAPGIAALAATLVADDSYRVTVVAPAEQQSGQGHALLYKAPIPVRPHPGVAGATTWSVAATPATVVKIGLSALLAEDPPDLVVSGINRGENVGRSAWYSGTVGAAREAALAGVTSIALSLEMDWTSPDPDWAETARWAKILVDEVRRHGLPEGSFLNVNLPRDPEQIRGFRYARMGLAPDAESRYVLEHEEAGAGWYVARWRPAEGDERGTDVQALEEGFVTVVPLGLDQTHYRALPELADLGLGRWDRTPTREPDAVR